LHAISSHFHPTARPFCYKGIDATQKLKNNNTTFITRLSTCLWNEWQLPHEIHLSGPVVHHFLKRFHGAVVFFVWKKSDNCVQTLQNSVLWEKMYTRVMGK
jgi:hypothetical protein